MHSRASRIRPRTLVREAFHAALLALCVALAGCAEVTSPPAAPAAEGEPAAPQVAESPPTDPGLGSHAHDYWSGRERVTLVDEDVDIEPLDVLEWGVVTTRIFRDPSFGGEVIQLPDGSLVYEGTGRLEIVATWSDTTITGLRFLHRHAGSGEISPWVDAPSGETVSIEVSPEMTDMPHAQTSRWFFLFAASGAPPVATGTFHLRIDIVKTRDVAEWPAHPDLWKGANELMLVEADGSSTQRIGPEIFPDPWAEPEDAIPSSAIVPMEAANLRVVVTVLSAQDPAGAGELYLLLRTASNVLFDFDDAGEPTDVSDDGLSSTWDLPIEMDQTDNPYASASAWSFRVRAGPADAPDLPFCEHGCYESEIQYQLAATVRRGEG